MKMFESCRPSSMGGTVVQPPNRSSGWQPYRTRLRPRRTAFRNQQRSLRKHLPRRCRWSPRVGACGDDPGL